MILVNDNSGNVNPCWRSGRPHGKVKDTTVVFLMNDFNPLTLQLWSQTSEVSALLQSLLFTYTQHLVKCFFFNSKSYCCNISFTTSNYISVSKEYLTDRQLIFIFRSVDPQLCCLKLLFKFSNFSRSYLRKQKVQFFF